MMDIELRGRLRLVCEYIRHRGSIEGCPVRRRSSRYRDHRLHLQCGRLVIESANNDDLGVFVLLGEDPRIEWPGDHPAAHGRAEPKVTGGELWLADGDGPWLDELRDRVADWEQAIERDEARRQQELEEQRRQEREAVESKRQQAAALFEKSSEEVRR